MKLKSLLVVESHVFKMMWNEHIAAPEYGYTSED
jgi:hypothetical protein